MSVRDGACDHCGDPLSEWYEVSAALAARSGEFPEPLNLAEPPAFCTQTCAVHNLEDRGFTLREPDAEEVAAREARARGLWPIWMETLSGLRTSPTAEGTCARCGGQLTPPAYEVLGFHPFTQHDITDVLELAEPLRFCTEECGRADLARRGLEVGRES